MNSMHKHYRVYKYSLYARYRMYGAGCTIFSLSFLSQEDNSIETVNIHFETRKKKKCQLKYNIKMKIKLKMELLSH